jgi:rod shape-determining protein MreB
MRLIPWKEQLAVDLGTAHVHICVKGGGVVVREPTVIAFSADRRRPVAYGSEAKQMLDREVSEVQVVRPLQGGVVADFDATVALLRHLIHQALGHRPLLAPTVVTAAPTRATQVEQRALTTALRAAGAGQVLAVPKVLAAAVGAGIAMDDPQSRLILDIGAGATDVGVVAMGMTAAGASIHFGGDDLDEAILEELAPNNNSGSNPSLDAIPELLAQAMRPAIAELQWVLESIPEKQQDEIANSDGVLTGGCALLRGLDRLLSQELALPIKTAPDPGSCTILGLEAIMPSRTDASSVRSLRPQVRPPPPRCGPRPPLPARSASRHPAPLRSPRR